MTPGEGRGIGCAVAFVLGTAGVVGLSLAVRHERGPREAGPIGAGPSGGDPGYAPEPPVEPVPGATVLTKYRGMSSMVAIDATHVYFVEPEPGRNDQYRGDVKSVPRAGGEVRTLARDEPQPSALTPSGDSLYYLTSSAVKKVPKSGGAAALLATASYPAFLTVEEGVVTWIDDRDDVVELGSDGARRRVATVSGEVAGFGLDHAYYYVGVRNPSGYRTEPGDPPPGRYGILRVPREEGAKPKILAQLDALTGLTADAEHVWWVGPTTSDFRRGYCAFNMSKEGGATARSYCDEKAVFSQLRTDGRRVWLASIAYGAGTYEELTVRLVGGSGEPTKPALRWAGSYPGGFGYAIADDAIAFAVKDQIAIVARD